MDQEPLAPGATPKASPPSDKVDLWGNSLAATPDESLNTKLTPPLPKSPTEGMPHAETPGQKYSKHFAAAARWSPPTLRVSFVAESGGAPRYMTTSEIGNPNLSPGVIPPPSASDMARAQIREPGLQSETRIAPLPEQHANIARSTGPAGRPASVGSFMGRAAGAVMGTALNLTPNFNAQAADKGRPNDRAGMSVHAHANAHRINFTGTWRF